MTFLPNIKKHFFPSHAQIIHKQLASFIPLSEPLTRLHEHGPANYKLHGAYTKVRPSDLKWIRVFFFIYISRMG